MGCVQGWVRGREFPEKRVYGEVASAAPPLPQLCPPSALLVLSQPAQRCPGGTGPSVWLRAWSGEEGVDFSLPAPAPCLFPRLPPPTSASRVGGPRSWPALQLLQGAVPRLPVAWMEVSDYPRASPLSGPLPWGETPRSPVHQSSSVGARA